MSASITESTATLTVASKPSKPRTFNSSVHLPYVHQWLDGNILDERELIAAPLTQDVTTKYLGKLRIVAKFSSNGKVIGNVETQHAEEAAREVFEGLFYAPNQNQGDSTDKGLGDFPEDQMPDVINATVMNLLAERPVFKRGDAGAPQPGEVVIKLNVWCGQTKTEEGDFESHFAETRLYYRTPKAADFTRWEEANNKSSVERNGQGKVASTTSRFDVQAIYETLFGSDIKGIQPLFLRGENYEGDVPFYHVYYAASELLKRDVDLGKLSQQLKAQS